jgi:hypothetical protein
MITMTISEFRAALAAQGATRREDISVVCPMCKTVQSAADLIAAGAGPDYASVERYLGFSCVGRFIGAGSPRSAPDGKPCNWTLGGLFEVHELEVVTEDGKHHPHFEVASALQLAERARI